MKSMEKEGAARRYLGKAPARESASKLCSCRTDEDGRCQKRCSPPEDRIKACYKQDSRNESVKFKSTSEEQLSSL